MQKSPESFLKLAYTLKDKLEGIARLYRVNRNEATHHLKKVEQITDDEQKNNLHQFRVFATTVFEAVDKLRQAQ